MASHTGSQKLEEDRNSNQEAALSCSFDSDEAASLLRANGPYGLLFGRSDLNLAVPIEGLPDEQRTSPVRRTYLLLVLFDLLLSFILWIIYVQQSRCQGDIKEGMKKEVLHYSFQTSLFDTVMTAVFRFIILELAYGACSCRVPWWSAVVTGGTTAVVVVKCFLFKFHEVDSTASTYAVIIAALVIAWIETSFLICRVIPQECAATQITSRIKESGIRGSASTLVKNLGRCRSRGPLSTYTASLGYHTPQGSLFGDYSLPQEPLSTLPTEAPADVAALLGLADLLCTRTWHLFKHDAWHQTPVTISNEYLKLQVAKLTGYKTDIFRAEGVVDAPAHIIYHDFVHAAERNTTWNPTLESTTCIQALLNENIDILHNTTAEAAGGLISARDFVVLRTWGERDGVLFVSSTSVEHPKCPPSKKYTRAEQIISACIIHPVIDEPQRSRVVWFLCNDIKTGYIPQRVVTHAMHTAFPQLFRAMQQHVKTLCDTVTTSQFSTRITTANVQPSQDALLLQLAEHDRSRLSNNGTASSPTNNDDLLLPV